MPTDQRALGRLIRARRIARLEVAVAVAAILLPFFLAALAPSFVSHPYVEDEGSPVWRDLVVVAGWALMLGGFAWMIRIWRRSGVDDAAPDRDHGSR